MKQKFSYIFLLTFILSLIVGLGQGYAQEVEYDILNQRIQAQISSDGSVHFEDHQTFQIDYMNGAQFKLDRTGYEVKDFKVGIIDHNTKEKIYFKEEATGVPQTFQVRQEADMYTFRAYYPSQNTEVTFVFEYTLVGLVTNYRDTAELNRKLVGTETDERLDVEATVILPGKVQNQDDFRAWAHGAPQGQVTLTEIDGKSAVTLTVEDNPPGQFVEADIIFPISLTPNNPNQVDEDRKSAIIERENQQVEADKKAYQARQSAYQIGIVILLILMPIVPSLTFLYYFRKRKQLNPKPAHVPEHVFNLPEEDLTPAVMATSLYRTKPITEDLTATVVDLARRGYIKLTEVKKEKRGIFFKEDTTTILVEPGDKFNRSQGLEKHEQAALKFILPDNQALTLQELEEKISKNNKFARKQNGHWTRFSDYTELKGEQIRGSEMENTVMMTLSIIGLIATPLLAIIVGALMSETTWEASIKYVLIYASLVWIGNFGVTILGLLRPLRTYEQDKRIKEWNAFRKMLDDIGNMQMREIGSLALWDEFLVYAISLGVADKVVDAMEVQFKPTELREANFGGGFYTNPYVIHRMMYRSIDHSVKTSNSKMAEYQASRYKGNNSGGFGGGFSGGSSGGSGGFSGSSGF